MAAASAVRHQVGSELEIPVALVGPSEAARRGREALASAARRRTPVLIVAEPGCRPASIVASLHARTRHGAALVALDCGAEEPAELDRRLFGASSRRSLSQDLESVGSDSALLAAASGTLFLENLDDLPASAQRRLARILRDGEVRQASHGKPVAVACRLVASTAHDLEAEVHEGRFRDDLRRRFANSRIVVPPLRQRPTDLFAIVERLLADADAAPRSFTQPAVTVLSALPWTQNIDQLAAVLTKILDTAGPVIRQEDVLTHVPIDRAFGRFDLTSSLRDARRRFERDYIAAVLERHQWRMRDAARTLGIERANLYRKTRQLGIARIPRAEVS